MKKIFTIIFSSLVLVTSCNEEIQENWTVDSLTISCESLEEAGDGNLKMILPTEFSGKLSLNIETNSPWQAEVGDITIQDEQWITLPVSEGQGNATLEIDIAPNYSAIDRIGSVVVTTSGNIPVKKTVTLIQGNTDDMLSIGFDGITLPKDVTITEGISGSWNMVLPKKFSADDKISVAISSTAYPSIEITYPEGSQGWINQDANISETSIATFSVTANSLNEYREALITFISKSGDVEVKKTLTVSQMGDEDISWCGDYLQGNIDELNKAEIILPSYILQNIKIADLKNITGSNIELPEQNDDDWFTVSIENNQVFITTIKENSTTNMENVKELVLKSKLSKKEFKITVRQCIKDYGTILNKKLWYVELTTTNVDYSGGSVKSLQGLYDNSWSTGSGNKLYVEFNLTKASETSLTFVFDLGDKPHQYTHLGLLPRIEWVAQSPKYVKIDYSENKEIWTEGSKQTAFTDTELKNNGYWITGDYTCNTIKWFEISKQPITSRYVRVTVSETLHFANYISFDEFFISDKSEI